MKYLLSLRFYLFQYNSNSSASSRPILILYLFFLHAIKPSPNSFRIRIFSHSVIGDNDRWGAVNLVGISILKLGRFREDDHSFRDIHDFETTGEQWPMLFRWEIDTARSRTINVTNVNYPLRGEPIWMGNKVNNTRDMSSGSGQYPVKGESFRTPC